MRKYLIYSLSVLIIPSFAFAGKKALIWDDAETLGTGNSQNENYFFYTKNTEDREGSYIFNFTYGYNDKTDIALNIPFGYLKNYENTYSDISDPFVEVKYRFFERENLKFAIKPFLGIPVKRDSDFSERHLSYGITLISQLEVDKFTFYANSSFMVHKDRIVGQNEIFQSISGEYNINDNFSVITSFYLSNYSSQTEKGGLIGVGYSKGKIEIGIGIGENFTGENDYSFYGGLTYRFF